MSKKEEMEDVEDEEMEEDEELEEEEDEEEEYNLRMFGIQAALPVPDGEPDWESGEPQTAEEYLRRVRAEAAACPRVVRVEFDPSKQAQGQDIAPSGPQGTAQAGSSQPESAAPSKSSQQGAGLGSNQQGTPTAQAGPGNSRNQPARQPHYLARLLAAGSLPEGPAWAQPSQQWVRTFVGDFRKLRQWVAHMAVQHHAMLQASKLPHLSNEQAWELLCFGSSPAPPPPPPHPDDLLRQSDAASASQPQQPSSPSQPATAASAQAGTGTGTPAGAAGGAPEPGGMEQVSGPLLRTVLALDQVAVGTLLQRHVARLQDQVLLGPLPAQWLFALCAALEKPAHSDVVAALRSLMRKVAGLRATLQSPSDPQVPRLNTLAAVVGAYFGQDERLVAWVTDLDMP